ncbi:MAG TPA: protein translocase subunit SecD [Oculatellaceae cyanobacterium]
MTSQRKPKSKKGFSTSLFKDWKPWAVVIVLGWSLFNLIQVAPQAIYDDWQYLGSLPPDQLSDAIGQRAMQTPNSDKMNLYEKEDLVKGLQDQAQMANNIQPFGHFHFNKTKYVVFTNLKLGLDLRGGSQLLLQALPAPPLVPEITPEVMRGVETVINNRINSLGVSETLVQRSGKDRLIVELPGIKDPQQAKDRIGTTAMLEFKELAWTPDGHRYWKDVGLTGAEFKHAQASPMVSGTGTWRVTFEFKPEGAKKFGELTTRLVGQPIGIFLDGQPTERGQDGRPISMQEYRGVNVHEPILGGTGEITGNFSKDQAVDLAVKLNAGALPVPVKILEERTVGATLGQDSIQKSLIAGSVGIAAVMLFMLVIYGLPGLVADTALVLYTLATLAAFKTIPVTLTLAGIAGFILSIGMAVDANILIFERTKEELKLGRSLYMAIENGFNRAFSSIFDSNANSLIACSVLMLFGTSIVKGFAFTLAIGVLISMFTAITATRALLHLVPRNLAIFGARHSSSTPSSKS